jgi:hypothetical protein
MHPAGSQQQHQVHTAIVPIILLPAAAVPAVLGVGPVGHAAQLVALGEGGVGHAVEGGLGGDGRAPGVLGVGQRPNQVDERREPRRRFRHGVRVSVGRRNKNRGRGGVSMNSGLGYRRQFLDQGDAGGLRLALFRGGTKLLLLFCRSKFFGLVGCCGVGQPPSAALQSLPHWAVAQCDSITAIQCCAHGGSRGEAVRESVLLVGICIGRYGRQSLAARRISQSYCHRSRYLFKHFKSKTPPPSSNTVTNSPPTDMKA